MWDFIWHLRGSTQVHGPVSNGELLDRVELLLEGQRKPANRRCSSEVTFDAPLWKDLIGPNWLAMVIYDYGSFWIEQSAQGRFLKYDLRSLHGFLFCLFAATVFFVVGLSDAGLWRGVRYAVFAFGWLYGMNMVLAWLRVPRAIRKAIADQ